MTETDVPVAIASSAPERNGPWRFFSLKPYGNDLLTRSGDFWIFSARLIIIAMAFAEAIAWGYVGSLMSNSYPMLTAAIVGTFIFLLIWIIDTSFMTLDLRSGEYEQAISGKKQNKRLERLKLFGGVGARVAIVTVSLLITAPFLAQAIFSGDVQAEMDRQNAASVADRRQEIENDFQLQIEDLRKEQRDLERQRVEEAAGVGLSGRHGRGPALETIERQLSDKNEQIRALAQSREAALRTFDGLTPAQLEQRHGLKFLEPGVHSSAAVLNDLAQDPQFGKAETALRAFLAFLFLGLLILKAFQPRSISVYFSEQLHSLYDQYRKGIFDSYLPTPERASAGGSIDPLRFEDWCLNTYSTIRSEEQQRRRTASQRGMHELMIEQWRSLENAATRELQPLIDRHGATISAIHELEETIEAAQSEIEALSSELRKVESSYGSMVRHVEGEPMDGAAFGRAVDAVKQLGDRKQSISRQIRNTKGSIDSSFRRLELKKTEAANLKQEIQSKQVVIADTQRRISTERMSLAGLIGSGEPSEDTRAPSWNPPETVRVVR